MEYVSVFGAFICFFLLVISIVAPNKINSRINKNYSRKKLIFIFGICIFIFVMIAPASELSTNEPEITESPFQVEKNNSESEGGNITTESEGSDDDLYDLNATVKYSKVAFQIINNEEENWTNCKLEMNSGLIRGGYIFKKPFFPSNQPIEIPFREFTKGDGTRFDSYETKPLNLSISCDIGDKGGFNYFEIE